MGLNQWEARVFHTFNFNISTHILSWITDNARKLVKKYIKFSVGFWQKIMTPGKKFHDRVVFWQKIMTPGKKFHDRDSMSGSWLLWLWWRSLWWFRSSPSDDFDHHLLMILIITVWWFWSSSPWIRAIRENDRGCSSPMLFRWLIRKTTPPPQYRAHPLH